jgi:glutamate-1-semialdehyde 2,1-aminomutase
MQLSGSKDYREFDIWKRAQDAVAQGALTNSKHPSSHVFGVYPTHMTGGSGGYLFDTNQKRYVDYICGLGANLFGYSPPKLTEHLARYLYGGFSHSFPTVHEVEAAEKLKTMFYFCDKFKFLKTGSAACSAAIKMARAYTGRKLVLSQGYHGHDDEFVSLTSPAVGVHTCMDIATYGDDIDLKDVAAVIIEPVITDASPERIAWLQDLRVRCTKAGTVLIFDEIITSFRFDKHSVAHSTNVLPDLICIGKAMANGLPLSAVGGRKEILDGPYFISTTFAGEILSLQSLCWTVDTLMLDPKFKIAKLWEAGERFIKNFNAIGAPFVSIEGYPTRGVIKGEPLAKALFFQEAVRAGFLFGPSFFYSFANMEHDFLLFTFLKDFCDRMKLGGIELIGDMPTSPFAERVRSGKAS